MSFLKDTFCNAGLASTASKSDSIDGDHEAAARVELTLPDTGVCGGAGTFDDKSAVEGSCCAPSTGPELITLSGPSNR